MPSGRATRLILGLSKENRDQGFQIDGAQTDDDSCRKGIRCHYRSQRFGKEQSARCNPLCLGRKQRKDASSSELGGSDI